MPWADPEKNAEAVRRWRTRNPGYWRNSARTRELPISRHQVLDEDLAQQAELYRLSRRKADHPTAYRQRERRWINATVWGGEHLDDG